jgi:exopolysaccharide production protein ExoZ
LLVYGILNWRDNVPNILILWGEASYILYLIHIVFYSIFGRGVEETTGVNVYGSTFYMLCLFVSVIVFSCLATKYLEYPYQAWYRKYLRRI